MSGDLRIAIGRGANDQLSFTVHGDGLPAGGQLLTGRDPLQLSADDVDQLRRGQPPPLLLQQMRQQVSEWFLGPDLPLALQTRLGLPGNGHLRLVIAVNDPLLLPMLAEIPLELVTLPHSVNPLILQPEVDAIVYELPGMANKTDNLTATNWPLRILIVHSNPQDLGGKVPDVTGLPQKIRDLRLDLNNQHLVIDILSRSSASEVVGKPTIPTLVGRLNTFDYDILVFVGHGELQTTFSDVAPEGMLQLENEDGEFHVSYRSSQLAGLLHRRPVPVVLLVGCLTAADLPDAIVANLPDWMRGSQGVAQALVNSQSGVHFAVGMRSRIDDVSAITFLTAFFRSLLKEKHGHVEAAVKAGRAEIHATNPNVLQSLAPMVFRAPPGNEPMFPFLAATPSCPSVTEFEARRAEIWKTLAQIPWSWRENPAVITPIHNLLHAQDTEMQQRFQDQGAALLMPEFWEPQPNDQEVSLPVHFQGNGPVQRLKASLQVIGAAEIIAVNSTPLLIDAGYDLFLSGNGNQATVIIEEAEGQAGVTLPEGALFEINLRLGPQARGVNSISLSVLKTSPVQLICGGSNAVIVAPAG